MNSIIELCQNIDSKALKARTYIAQHKCEITDKCSNKNWSYIKTGEAITQYFEILMIRRDALSRRIVQKVKCNNIFLVPQN